MPFGVIPESELALMRQEPPVARNPKKPRGVPNGLCVQCLSRICEHMLPVPVRVLARNELRVLQALANGLCNKDIADILGWKPRSVNVYVSRIFTKLRVTNRLEAALWARDHLDLLGPPEV